MPNGTTPAPTPAPASPYACNGLPTDPAVLRQRLADVDAAWHQLMTGGKAKVVSYGQGVGTKSVTYTEANMAMLSAYRGQLLQALGYCCRPRRAIGFRF
jgi:hypothetical protein